MGCEGQPEGSEGLPEWPEGLPEGSEGLSEGSEGLPEGPEGLPERPKGLPSTRGGGMDRWMNKQNFSPFYRTLSPVGAAAQKHVNCPILSVSESLPYLSHHTQGIVNQTSGAIGIFIKGFKKQQQVSPIQIHFPQSNSLPLNSISSNPGELILHLSGSSGPYHT